MRFMHEAWSAFRPHMTDLTHQPLAPYGKTHSTVSLQPTAGFPFSRTNYRPLEHVAKRSSPRSPLAQLVTLASDFVQFGLQHDASLTRRGSVLVHSSCHLLDRRPGRQNKKLPLNHLVFRCRPRQHQMRPEAASSLGPQPTHQGAN
jgi:hypothetical protein